MSAQKIENDSLADRPRDTSQHVCRGCASECAECVIVALGDFHTWLKAVFPTSVHISHCLTDIHNATNNNIASIHQTIVEWLDEFKRSINLTCQINWL